MNHLIQKLTDEGRFFQAVDGCYYFDLGEGQGALATHNLRAIADELDRLNNETPKHLPAETADRLNTALRKFLLKSKQPRMDYNAIIMSALNLRDFLDDRKLLRELQAAAIEHQKQFITAAGGNILPETPSEDQIKSDALLEPRPEDLTPGVRGFDCGMCGKPVTPRRMSKKADGWHWHKECWNKFSS